MTGYARKFDKNTTMSFRVDDKNLFEIIIKYGKKLENYYKLILKANLLMVMMINT